MRSTRPWLVTLATALVASASLLQGCGPREIAYNSNSGPDGVRDTATQLYLNTSEDDRCNADEGDHEDWRYLLIEKPGLLRVSVRVDNPRMDANVYLHDGFGRAIDRLNVNGSSDFYEFNEIEVPVGRYYFRMACNSGQSVYTVSATFREPERVAEPETVFVVDATPEPPKEDPKPRVKKKPAPKPEPKKEEPKKEEPKVVVEAPKEEPAPEPVSLPPKSVVGTITLVTPSDGGKAKITIRGIGSKYGVDSSMKGKLKNKGKTVTLIDCEASKCQGIVEADQEELKQYNEVEFIVPQK